MPEQGRCDGRSYAWLIFGAQIGRNSAERGNDMHQAIVITPNIGTFSSTGTEDVTNNALEFSSVYTKVDVATLSIFVRRVDGR